MIHCVYDAEDFASLRLTHGLSRFLVREFPRGLLQGSGLGSTEPLLRAGQFTWLFCGGILVTSQGAIIRCILQVSKLRHRHENKLVKGPAHCVRVGLL